MKKISFFLLLICHGCYFRFQNFQYDKTKYSVESDKIGYNGYYYTYEKVESDSDSLLNMLIFYTDGSVLLAMGFEDHNQYKNEVVNHPNADYGLWGKYRVQRDSLIIELVQPDEYSHRFEIIKNQFYIPNKEKLILENLFNSRKKMDFYFYPTLLKPDSTSNWLKRHRKYKDMW